MYVCWDSQWDFIKEKGKIISKMEIEIHLLVFMLKKRRYRVVTILVVSLIYNHNSLYSI